MIDMSGWKSIGEVGFWRELAAWLSSVDTDELVAECLTGDQEPLEFCGKVLR